MLFLSLVGLSIVVVEHLPAPHRARPRPAPAAPTAPAVLEEPEPVAVLDHDWLVLRLGGSAPVPLPAPGVAPAAPRPAPEPAAKAAAAQDTYVVQPGDTLSGIAQRELGSAQLAGELARLNRLADPAAIRAGQILRLR